MLKQRGVTLPNPPAQVRDEWLFTLTSASGVASMAVAVIGSVFCMALPLVPWLWPVARSLTVAALICSRSTRPEGWDCRAGNARDGSGRCRCAR